MNIKTFSDAMSEIDNRYVSESICFEKKTDRKPVFRTRVAAAVCFSLVIASVFAVFPDWLQLPGEIRNNSGETVRENPPSDSSQIRISMDTIIFNDVEDISDTSVKWFFDPQQYNYQTIQWGKEDIEAYYGKDLDPPYIPDGLTSSPQNSTALVIIDDSGEMLMDTVSLCFYHEFLEDGNPNLTEGTAAVREISVNMSKVGLVNDCIYLLPEDEVQTSDINGITVTFGYRSMAYGPYDADTHRPSGYYDMYTAEFSLDEIQYQIISRQIEAEELVKVVASVICGREVSVDR